jgi:metal-responsive CopG/Arc/MetJ family transcriptional regulator
MCTTPFHDSREINPRLKREYNHGHTSIMKTAISIPDALFREAESLAKKRGMSRSELYATAIAAYVKDGRFLGVREQLDAMYAADPQASELDAELATMQSQSLLRERW